MGSQMLLLLGIVETSSHPPMVVVVILATQITTTARVTAVILTVRMITAATEQESKTDPYMLTCWKLEKWPPWTYSRVSSRHTSSPKDTPTTREKKDFRFDGTDPGKYDTFVTSYMDRITDSMPSKQKLRILSYNRP